MSSRKAPRCRSCKHPMKGHNKLGLCMSASPEVLSREEEEVEQLQLQQQQHQQHQQQAQAQAQAQASGHSYMSPPPTPPPSSAAAATAGGTIGGPAPAPNPLAHQRPPLPRTYTPAIMSEPSFTIPETGYFHRRNPNFVHALAPPPPPPHSRSAAFNTHLPGGGGGGARPYAAATREYHYATHDDERYQEEDDDEDEDEEYNGGPGAQTPTVIVGSDGETVEALSDRSGSASPGPPPLPPPPGHYLSTTSGSSFASSSSTSFFGRAGYGRGHSAAQEERAVYKRMTPGPPAPARHSRSPRPLPRPPAPQRHGSVIAGGLSYLGSFRWIRSPTPEEIHVDSLTTSGAKHRAGKQGHRHHRTRSHSHSQNSNNGGAGGGAAAGGGGETKIATRDIVVFGLILVLGCALSMMLVMYVGLRSLRSFLEGVGFGSGSGSVN